MLFRCPNGRVGTPSNRTWQSHCSQSEGSICPQPPQLSLRPARSQGFPRSRLVPTTCSPVGGGSPPGWVGLGPTTSPSPSPGSPRNREEDAGRVVSHGWGFAYGITCMVFYRKCFFFGSPKSTPPKSQPGLGWYQPNPGGSGEKNPLTQAPQGVGAVGPPVPERGAPCDRRSWRRSSSSAPR